MMPQPTSGWRGGGGDSDQQRKRGRERERRLEFNWVEFLTGNSLESSQSVWGVCKGSRFSEEVNSMELMQKAAEMPRFWPSES